MPLRTTPEAYDLLHDGQVALSTIEGNGIRVDKGYLDATISTMEARIADLDRGLKEDSLWVTWKKAFGNKANADSREQLGVIVFDKLGYESKDQTATGRAKTDKVALERVDIPFVKDFLQVESLKKTLSTYLLGIRREVVEREGDWFVYPSHNLNLAATMRSAGSQPNWKNIPIRNPEIAELIRRCYVPRKGNYFTEVDLSQAEVRVAACYNHDPVLIKYIKDKTKDMHRDMACQIFFLKPDQVNKASRHTAKNRFVFPEFYGASWFACAIDLWNALWEMNLKVADVPMKDHLAANGIHDLDVVVTKDKDGRVKLGREPGPGTFGDHLKRIHDHFWNTRFKTYTEWKRAWWDAYCRDGGFMTLTGFAMTGPMSRNEVINYGVQCDAFQCELLTLALLIPRLKRHRMKTQVLGEIYDSHQADVPPKELNAYLDLCHGITTKEVLKRFDWLIVDLETESEVAPVNKSWHEKKSVTRNEEGVWK